ncbi:MAG: flagellar assembly protein FliH [Candidatus Accumulibacter sp.]|jgi:flagellar assembly protein FliH|nr:flagellar assembly protein FliH [Accumulibacter sp.]
MTGFIPREKLTAYQRWELAAFDEEQAEAPPDKAKETGETPPAAAPAAQAPEPPEQPAIVLPTAADIERMHDEAHEQGYSEGYSEGYSAGQAEGRAAGHTAGQAEGLAEARELAARIAEILGNLERAAEEIEQRVAEQLLDTAVEIAGQVLRQSLRIKPELLLPVVREAIDALPFGSGHPALLLHPGDAALVRAQMGDHLAHNRWRIIEDASLTPGGCRIELNASEVDATVETRWRRVIETIGVSRDWLDDAPTRERRQI